MNLPRSSWVTIFLFLSCVFYGNSLLADDPDDPVLDDVIVRDHFYDYSIKNGETFVTFDALSGVPNLEGRVSFLGSSSLVWRGMVDVHIPFKDFGKIDFDNLDFEVGGFFPTYSEEPEGEDYGTPPSGERALDENYGISILMEGTYRRFGFGLNVMSYKDDSMGNASYYERLRENGPGPVSFEKTNREQIRTVFQAVIATYGVVILKQRSDSTSSHTQVEVGAGYGRFGADVPGFEVDDATGFILSLKADLAFFQDNAGFHVMVNHMPYNGNNTESSSTMAEGFLNFMISKNIVAGVGGKIMSMGVDDLHLPKKSHFTATLTKLELKLGVGF